MDQSEIEILCQKCNSDTEDVILLTCEHQICLSCAYEQISKNRLTNTTFQTVFCDQCKIATVLEPDAAHNLTTLNSPQQHTPHNHTSSTKRSLLRDADMVNTNQNSGDDMDTSSLPNISKLNMFNASIVSVTSVTEKSQHQITYNPLVDEDQGRGVGSNNNRQASPNQVTQNNNQTFQNKVNRSENTFERTNTQSNSVNNQQNQQNNENVNPSRETFNSIISNDRDLTKTIPSFLSRIESDTSEINVINLNLNRLNKRHEFKSPDVINDNYERDNQSTNTPDFETVDSKIAQPTKNLELNQSNNLQLKEVFENSLKNPIINNQNTNLTNSDKKDNQNQNTNILQIPDPNMHPNLTRSSFNFSTNKKISENNNESLFENCSSHPDEVCNYLCTDNLKIICAECIINGDQRRNNCVKLTKAQDIICNEIKSCSAKLNELTHQVEINKKSVDFDLENQNAKFNQARNQLSQMFDEIIQYINEKRNNLLNSQDNIFNKTQEEFYKKKNNLDSFFNDITDLNKYISKIAQDNNLTVNNLVDFINNIHPKTLELFKQDPTCSFKEIINRELSQMAQTIENTSNQLVNIKNISQNDIVSRQSFNNKSYIQTNEEEQLSISLNGIDKYKNIQKINNSLEQIDDFRAKSNKNHIDFSMPINIHMKDNNNNMISSYSKYQTKKEQNLQKISLTDSKYNKIIESKRKYINDMYRNSSNENDPQRHDKNLSKTVIEKNKVVVSPTKKIGSVLNNIKNSIKNFDISAEQLEKSGPNGSMNKLSKLMGSMKI